jgi:single-strand DNA-binding protein
MSVNKQILIGRLGHDPRIAALQNGTSVMNFSLATSERIKDNQEEVTWHKCILYGNLVDSIKQYVKKGTQLYIEGKTRHRKYENKQGVEVWTTEVIVNKLVMLGSAPSKAEAPAGQKENETNYDNDTIPF